VLVLLVLVLVFALSSLPQLAHTNPLPSEYPASITFLMLIAALVPANEI
jgi:peptidoglycan/LPS O-acetylase OafA/YrhL